MALGLLYCLSASVCGGVERKVPITATRERERYTRDRLDTSPNGR